MIDATNGNVVASGASSTMGDEDGGEDGSGTGFWRPM